MTHRLLLANTTIPAGNVVANTTTQTLFTDQAIAISPNGDIATGNGRLFKLKAFGYVSSAASGPGTLKIGIGLTVTGTTTLLTSGTLTLPASLANAGFLLDGYALICATGNQAQAKLAAGGMLLLDNAGSPVSAALVNIGTGTVAQQAVQNGTQSNLNIGLGLTAQFSASSSANSITLSQLLIEACQ